MSAIFNQIINIFNLSFLLSTPQDRTFEKTDHFDVSAWKKNLNLLTNAPPIPEEFLKILQQSCQFWPNRKVEQTHIFCLVPEGMTPSKLEALFDSRARASLADEEPVKESYWILITKKIIPDSQGLNFEQQKQLLAKYNYEVPTKLEAEIAVLATRLLNDVSIYPSEKFTRCSKKQNGWPVAVGSDSNTIFCQLLNDWDHPHGIAGVLRSNKLSSFQRPE